MRVLRRLFGLMTKIKLRKMRYFIPFSALGQEVVSIYNE